MSLINCYECQKEISDLAITCPRCGAPRHILISIRKGDFNSVESYISSGGDINEKFDDGSPLNTASALGYKNIVELLISKGADVNGVNKHGATPLIAAVSEKRNEIIKILLSNGADINKAHEKNPVMTPLLGCLFKYDKETGLTESVLYNKEAALLLIENGVDINATIGTASYSYLHMAVVLGNYEVAKFLIDHGIKTNIISTCPFTSEKYAGQTPIELAYGFTVESDTPDVIKNRDKIFKLLKTIEPISKGIVLHYVVLGGHVNAINRIIEDGVNINYRNDFGDTPLHTSIITKDHQYKLEVIKILLDLGADVNAQNENHMSALHVSVSTGYHEITELLIENGANINIVNADGLTPLHWASMEGDKKIAKLLITNGADVNAKDKHERTPLDWANDCLAGSSSKRKTAKKEIVELLKKNGGEKGHIQSLLEAGANTVFSHFLTDQPEISIHEAVEDENIEAVKQHLVAGTDVNEENDWGTPLHRAAQIGLKEIAKLLIDAGADVNAKTDGGSTALDMATDDKRADRATIQLLVEHGAKTGDWFNARESIHSAARAGHIEAVKQHIAAGTDMNVKDEESIWGGGMPPLHWAIYCNGATGNSIQVGACHKEVVELLIAAGADLNAKDGWYGETPLDEAIESDETEIADLLRKHGAKTSEELKAEGK